MNIFCSGIGGIGLSAYACHMCARGHNLWGSDKNDSALVADLRKQGIQVSLKQDGSALPAQLDLLVYSEAIPATAPERELAKQRGIRQISYFAALGEMTAGQRLIAVCGTHGKSSTTAMTARMLMELGLDPNVVVGTKLRELDGRNWRKSANDLWVAEACEYRKSFHYLQPSIILLTNADGDHYDAYADIAEYESAFVDFIKLLPEDGVVIAHGADAQVRSIVERAGRKLIDADTQPLLTLATPGMHMRKNAQLSLALAAVWKLDVERAQRALSGYSGSWRRMEVKGRTATGATVIDDYGHHPVEIRATLQGAKEAYPARRIVAVFQPHTNNRTLALWNEFAASFTDAAEVVVLPVYDARPDRDAQLADTAALAAAITSSSGVPCRVVESLSAAEALLNQTVLKQDDVAVVLGAGDSTALAGRLAVQSA